MDDADARRFVAAYALAYPSIVFVAGNDDDADRRVEGTVAWWAHHLGKVTGKEALGALETWVRSPERCGTPPKPGHLVGLIRDDRARRRGIETVRALSAAPRRPRPEWATRAIREAVEKAQRPAGAQQAGADTSAGYRGTDQQGG